MNVSDAPAELLIFTENVQKMRWFQVNLADKKKKQIFFYFWPFDLLNVFTAAVCFLFF